MNNKFFQPSLSKLDRDPGWFMLFLTLVVAIMYVTTLVSHPENRQVGRLILLTLLIIIHLLLHWLLFLIAERPAWVSGYIFFQGALAFAITWISGNIGMVFALYMGLIGEGIGLLGLNRRGILSAIYYLALLLTGVVLLLGWKSAGWWALGTIPVVIFVIVYVVMYSRQLEARAQAQELLRDLEAANRQLSEYAARVEDLTIADERQRMARELHDTLSQGLAGMILQLEAVDAHLSGDRPERARAILRQAMEKARGTLSEARLAISNLRQPGERDLVESIRQESERFTRASGIACETRIDPCVDIPEAVSETILRAVSESLTNVARHAHASHARVSLTASENGKDLVAEIRDDGIGFDPDGVQAGHYGLVGIRERVRLAGGSYEVRSEPGKGTGIVIRFPLETPP